MEEMYGKSKTKRKAKTTKKREKRKWYNDRYAISGHKNIDRNINSYPVMYCTLDPIEIFL